MMQAIGPKKPQFYKHARFDYDVVDANNAA
jgi:hypothetical protein